MLQGGDRDRRLRQAFTATARVTAATPGSSVLVSPAGTAAALWFGPGRWRPPLQAALSQSPALLHALRTGAARAVRLQRAMARVHTTEPHWYLEALGVVPQAQGLGAGATVLAPVLACCDADGLAAYLESSNPRNWSFYERHGFEPVAPVPVPRRCPPMMTFRRRPRPA